MGLKIQRKFRETHILVDQPKVKDECAYSPTAPLMRYGPPWLAYRNNIEVKKGSDFRRIFKGEAKSDFSYTHEELNWLLTWSIQAHLIFLF